MRSMSASGPLGPSFFGVWQSWQPPPMINLWPRSICDIAGAAAGAAFPVLAGAGAAGSLELQLEIAIATGISERTATRDKHKRMSLHSFEEKGCARKRAARRRAEIYTNR